MKPVNKYVHNCSMQCPSNKKQLNKPAICQTKKKIKEQVEKGSNETTIYRDRYGLWSLRIKRFSSFSYDKLFQFYVFLIRLGSFFLQSVHKSIDSILQWKIWSSPWIGWQNARQIVIDFSKAIKYGVRFAYVRSDLCNWNIWYWLCIAAAR